MKSTGVDLKRPEGRARAAMISSESSSAGGVQLPDSTTPFVGTHPSSGGIHEEPDGETTPVPARGTFRAETGDMSIQRYPPS